jgi:ABC-2 type transport system permease protein
MSTATWLIASREFRTYAATWSFWIALALGPLAAFFAAGLPRLSSTTTPVLIYAADPALLQAATAAVLEAGEIEGHKTAVGTGNSTAADLSVSRTADGSTVELHFDSGFPLSRAGRALVARSIETALLRENLAAAGSTPPVIRQFVPPPPVRNEDPDQIPRIASTMILWFVLVGSLGMLLQAVVRERANRALEMLLAAADPWEIVAGKVLGVGALSAVLVLAWLGSAAVASIWVSPAEGVAGLVFVKIAAASNLARAALIYILAFAFYGLITVAIGAMARDSATAQILSRPMFAVLLVVFFVTLAGISGAAGGLHWLVYVPVFTPFLLLLWDPNQISVATQLGAICLMLASIAVAGRFATDRLKLSGR